MKNTIIVLLLMTYSAAVFGQPKEHREVRQLQPFDKIKISKGINVTLREGDNPEAEIIIANANLDDVLISQENKEVFIRMKTKVYKNVMVNVYVTFQELKEIQAGTGGSLDSEDIIEAEELTLTAGMDASIDLEVEVGKLIVSASVARIQVSGTADKIDVNISSGGKYFGYKLECQDAKIRAVSGALAQVWVTENLDAYAATGAIVEYIGAPLRVDSNVLLGGKVLEVGEGDEEDEEF